MKDGLFCSDFCILLPQDIDMSKWATVACDQFNADKKYWQQLDEYVGDAPSTLRLMYPEIFLGNDQAMRIASINRTMKKYVQDKLFDEVEGFVLVEREVEGGKKRIGLVLAVDIEAYDFSGIKSYIRPTEDTILSRLPVRVEIRRDAALELPHVLMLIDDERREIIESIYRQRASLRKLYDFELNMGGGRIRGYEVADTAEVIQKLYALLDSKRQIAKYGIDEGFLLAVGDGNHSVATAKVLWEEIKKNLTEEERKTHPARYFLCELINIYDDDLTFLPIHRIVLAKDKDKFLSALAASLDGEGKVEIITRDKRARLACPQSPSLAIKAIQEFLEDFAKHNQIEIEYVHGDEHLTEAVEEHDGIGIFMPYFKKSELFSYVVNQGNLPKKAFSIGDAEYKRYYLESKMIKQ